MILAATRRDAASYYRIAVPFGLLKYRGLDVEIRSLDGHEVAEDIDVLWLQMHSTADDLVTAMRVKDAGGAVVYDVDDYLFELPPSWAAYDTYYVRGTGEPTSHMLNHVAMLRLADVVTTTTAHLKRNLIDRLPELHDRVITLPNYVLAGDWDTLPAIGHTKPGPVLGWFGTGNHWDDWFEIADTVDRVLEDVGGFLGVFGAPELLACFPKRLRARTLLHPITPIGSFGEIRSLMRSVDVALAWCTDRLEISRCRSPLKALQWGAAGVPLVASRTVYGGSRCHAVTDREGLMPELLWALQDALEIKGQALERREEVLSSFSYELHAEEWREVIDGLMS